MPKPLWQNFTDEELKLIVSQVYSFHSLQEKLGYSSKSGSVPASLKRMMEEKNIDFSHFKGQAWNKQIIEISDMNDFGVSNKTTIRKMLLKEREYKCEKCGNSIWLNEKIPLQVHHIDGNTNNNTRNNLQLLCPNCHALTENWCHKNIKNKKKVSDEQFLEALSNTSSICAACRVLNISPNQSNYNRAKELLELNQH